MQMPFNIKKSFNIDNKKVWVDMKKSVILFFVLILLILVSCQGPMGPEGPIGPV